MRKIFTAIGLILTVLLLISGCKKEQTVFSFNGDSLTVKSDSEQLKPELESHVNIAADGASVKAYGADEVTNHAGVFKTHEGIGIGSTAEDFAAAYALSSSNAMWETYIYKSDAEAIVNYADYTGEMMKFDSCDDRYLTVGYVENEDGTWSVLPYSDIKSVWDLETDAKKHGSMVLAIVSAGLDKNGVINNIQIDYGTYSSFFDEYSSEM